VTGHCEGVGPLRNERRDCTQNRSRNFCPHVSEKQGDGGTPGPTGTLSENRSRRVALRRGQWQQLESDHRENRDTGEKGETDHTRHTSSPRKRTDSMSVGAM
jgi:hypothetical protein